MADAIVGSQIDLFVFDRAPEPLEEDVVVAYRGTGHDCPSPLRTDDASGMAPPPGLTVRCRIDQETLAAVAWSNGRALIPSREIIFEPLRILIMTIAAGAL